MGERWSAEREVTGLSPTETNTHGLYHEICFITLRRDFGLFCSINHFSEGGVNENHNVTCLLSLAENDSRLPRIAKEIAMVSGFFVE